MEEPKMKDSAWLRSRGFTSGNGMWIRGNLRVFNIEAKAPWTAHHVNTTARGDGQTEVEALANLLTSMGRSAERKRAELVELVCELAELTVEFGPAVEAEKIAQAIESPKPSAPEDRFRDLAKRAGDTSVAYGERR